MSVTTEYATFVTPAGLIEGTGNDSAKNWLDKSKSKFEERQAGNHLDKEVLRELKVADNMASCRHGFTLAFYFLLRLKEGCTYELAVRETIRQGGDTDTNACIVGAMVAAALGYDSIPEHMRNLVLEFDCVNATKLKRPDYLSIKR